MKYTTIKGTTIAGDVPCETDGWVRKADLRKLRGDLETERLHAVDNNEWYADGVKHCVDRIDKLLEG